MKAHLRTAAFVVSALALAGAASACGKTEAREVPGGDSSKGNQLLRTYGCGSCHSVPGVSGADGRVGPPLNDFADRQYIAGKYPNTAENLIAWIMHPQKLDPGVAMPEMSVTEQDATDIAAFLYTLR